MRRSKVITGLDIGSSKVSAVSASITKDGQFAITAQATQPSRGVSRGTIVDFNDAVHSVSGVLKKLKGKVSGSLGEIYVNISGDTLKGTRSKGMIPLSVRGREITRADIARCVDAASTIHLPFDREIVHKIVQKFSVDDQLWIKNPLGLYASRVACEAYIITASVNSIQNITKCVNSAGCDVKGIVYTGIADGTVVLNREGEDSGAILLTIGAGLTEITVFAEGTLCDMEILLSGTEDFKDDFRTSAAFNNVLSRIASKLQDFRAAGNNLSSVVVTGGMIFADGLIEYLEEKLSCPVRMGVAKEIKGDISGPDGIRLCTAIGLAKYAAAKYENTLPGAKNMAERVSTAVIDIFNNYF